MGKAKSNGMISFSAKDDPINSKVYDFFVKDRFPNYTDYDEETITPETKIKELGLDSLDIVELVMDAEMEYDLDNIPDSETDQIVTVGGLVLVVAQKIKDKR